MASASAAGQLPSRIISLRGTSIPDMPILSELATHTPQVKLRMIPNPGPSSSSHTPPLPGRSLGPSAAAAAEIDPPTGPPHRGPVGRVEGTNVDRVSVGLTRALGGEQRKVSSATPSITRLFSLFPVCLGRKK